MNHKIIDINQRIPLDTLIVALEGFIQNKYDEEYIIEQLRLEFKGENRLKKSIKIVNKIIPKNPYSDYLLENKSEIVNAIKMKNDRNIILISLLNSAYVFSFDLLRLLGKYLTVQDLISSKIIMRDTSSVYGSNRATQNAIYSIIPMLIEAGFISRIRSGVYSRNLNLKINFSISRDLFIKSFEKNAKLNIPERYEFQDPYFLFIKPFA